MKGPMDVRRKGGSLRQLASRRAREAYPAGKALGRIEYFETQRALPRTRESEGVVTSALATAPRIARRASSRRKPAPRSKYTAAHVTKARLAPSFAAATELPVWRAIGPSRIPNGQTYGSARPAVSGRCGGLVISPTDPRRLVLCSGGGGLWGSADRGATWQPLTDDQPTTSMGAIAAAPGAPHVVYAGTGEGDNQSQLGVGLLRSSDGGQTWQLMPAAVLSGTGVYDIEVDPADPLHVWVGTLEKLLESTNGGATWRVVQSVPTWDISINPGNPLEVFAATRAGLIRSTDGGATWSLVSLPGSTSGIAVRAARGLSRAVETGRGLRGRRARRRRRAVAARHGRRRLHAARRRPRSNAIPISRRRGTTGASRCRQRTPSWSTWGRWSSTAAGARVGPGSGPTSRRGRAATRSIQTSTTSRSIQPTPTCSTSATMAASSGHPTAAPTGPR